MERLRHFPVSFFAAVASLALWFPAHAGDGEWTLYVGRGCQHCAKVEAFVAAASGEYTDVAVEEVFSDAANREAFLARTARLGIPQENLGIPLLVAPDGRHATGDVAVIALLKEMAGEFSGRKALSGESSTVSGTGSGAQEAPVPPEGALPVPAPWAVLLALLPAALADSVNPCEFAVLLLLLGAILDKSGSRRRALASGLAFSAAVFASYFAMGAGLYSALEGSASFWFRIAVGSLGIAVALANLKDYFWWGRWFVMEVPLSWRPRLKSIMRSVVSPGGAFVSGLAVSLFLLPCTSGPYLTALGYLGSRGVGAWAWAYLAFYNSVFVMPMLAVTVAVVSGRATVARLEEKKEAWLEKTHLVVGLLMLGLGAYVLWDAFGSR